MSSQDQSALIKKFKIKVDELKRHNHFYFNDDNPRISDADYDKLKKEILNLEKNLISQRS